MVPWERCVFLAVHRLKPDNSSLDDIHESLGYETACTTCRTKSLPASEIDPIVGPQSATNAVGEPSAQMQNTTAYVHQRRLSKAGQGVQVHSVTGILVRTDAVLDIRSPNPLEELLHRTATYFQHQCRTMRLDEQGVILALDGAKLSNDLCSDFDSYCFTATMIARKKGPAEELFCVLDKASRLVEPILRAKHPRTLACFLEVFIHFIQCGLPELTHKFCKYIKAMSVIVVGDKHPLGSICWLLGKLDTESLTNGMALVWQCMTDIFIQELTVDCPLAVSIRLDYVKRVFAANPQEEEALLQKLRADLGDSLNGSTPRVLLNIAHNLNRRGEHSRAREMAEVVLTLLQGEYIYAGRTVKKIECLKIIAYSYYNQRDMQVKAYQTLGDALEMIKNCLEPQHPWVTEFNAVLEDWCQEWGWIQEAEKIRTSLRNLIIDGSVNQVIEQLESSVMCKLPS